MTEPERPDLPPGLTEEQLNDMMGGANELTDMAAVAAELYKAYCDADFIPSMALYCVMAVLTGNPLLAPGR